MIGMRDASPVPWKIAAALAVVALFAGWALVGGPPGIGFPVTAFLMTGVVVASDRSITRDPWSIAFGGIALALASMAALRTAGWIVTLDLMLCIAYGVLAVNPVSTWAAAFRTETRFVLTTLGAPFRLAEPLFERIGSGDKERLVATLRSVAIGAFLVLGFGILFATADPAFAQVAEELFTTDLDYDVMPARVFTSVVAFALAGAFVLRRPAFAAPDELIDDPFGPAKRSPRMPQWIREWTIPLVALDLLFIAFVAVQFAVLFGGRDHVLETTGLTYAQYARMGFFQLLAVAFLTIAVVMIAARRIDRDNRHQRILGRLLLGILCACTFVILVSAMKRLSLYEEAYGFTRLRLAVHATIVWLAVVFALIVAAGTRMRTAWLPKTVWVATGVGVLAFTLVNPDGLIARRNAERSETTGKLDLGYLERLSLDAVPALTELPEGRFACIADTFEHTTAFDEPWSSANLAREQAEDALAARSGSACHPSD